MRATCRMRTMRYSGNTPKSRAELLAAIGVKDLEELFATVPDEVRMDRDLDVLGPWPEAELLRRLEEMKGPRPRVSLVGAGLYRHYIPSPAVSLAGRSEWVTSYTPYQPELAQGTLTMYYEFQTYMAMLTGQEVANGGMYDGSTSLAEAVMMALRIRKKAKTLYVSEGVHPEYREVVDTYMSFQDVEIRTLPVDRETGRTVIDVPPAELEEALAVVLQTPNFFGVIEDQPALRDDVFVIGVCAEAQSMALLPPLRCDIMVGEAQSLGIQMQLGGPTAGFFATSKKHVRNLPGRLVGRTEDKDGREAFCITLATREQFIRRGKATSNICTASGLMCLRVAVYLSLMGREGLQDVARRSARAARRFAAGLESLGLPVEFKGSYFNEFVVDARNRPGLWERLRERGFLLGVPLERWFKDLEGRYLVALTEMDYPRVDRLLKEVTDVANDS